MVERSEANASKGAAIIGSSVAAVQAALTLAQIGVEVKLITNSAALGRDDTNSNTSGKSPDQRYIWPLLLQASNHPLITLYSSAEVEDIAGEKGNFKIQVLQSPRFVNEELCTACNRCEAECSVRVTSLLGGQKIEHGAIHTPLLGTKSVPSTYLIDKNGLAPCHVACPLGINVQGFVSLLSKGKVDKALELINESAPFGGILGRVCRHPCEDNCNRAEVDSPVSIRALHRYAADNAPGGIKYGRKFPYGSRGAKIAIVGSGPAGLTAAWQLTRLGYLTTVFEAHGVIGGMLATGIPRFRLPKEVREREIEAIKALGVDIRTGITVGRDVTFAYLRERGYQAFFLAIGAQQNNRLNIPGEGLDGVVDCMSLLLTLNLMVDTFVGTNIVIIGDGKSAIDSARAAIRTNKGSVKMISWTVPDEVTAGEEELEEALQEGVSIEYCVEPVEILGEGGKVAGIHCQRTRLTEKVMTNGQHLPEPIPGTDFVIDADHVVVAVGQSPNALQLNIGGLSIDNDTGVIKVNPLTLETSIPGFFAGGDCIIGPNNVVEAMAAGLRAAESIDRYLQGRDLEAERSLVPPPVAEIDLETTEILPYEREKMPVIRFRKRLDTYEETTLGFSAEAARREAQRCLNCALCSQCMECTTACELGAVSHNDVTRHFEVGVESILRFPSVDSEEGSAVQESTQAGINIISPDNIAESSDVLAKAMAVALDTAIELKPRRAQENPDQDSKEADVSSAHSSNAQTPVTDSKRIGVFLCRCGGSISSVIDFKSVSRKLSDFLGVTYIREIAQACTEAGARQIADQAVSWQLDRVVLAACRCCNFEQVCYSCTDRRQMCQQHLYHHLVLPQNTIVEFCNIREQCAWIHQDDPKGATRKAVQIISAAVTRSKITPPIAIEEKPILPSVFILGEGLVSTTIGKALACGGYHVELVTRNGLKEEQHKLEATIPTIFEQFPEEDLVVKPWPDSVGLSGSPGSYEVMLRYGAQSDRIVTGAIVVDMEEFGQVSPIVDTTPSNGLLGRIISRRKRSGSSYAASSDLLREITISETAGMFLLSPDSAEAHHDRVLLGLATAARVSAYVEQASVRPRATAVDIDSGRCRGCGNCAEICPYIEMRKREDGTVCAYIDKVLCLGCGACITSCPTGAITQPQQSDKQLISSLRSMLQTSQVLSGV
ncbi:FAD-dependent oxidoreductase [Chloroflexota bacterium]